MSEYVTKVRLEINGRDIEDFSSVTEGEVEVGAQVKLMNTTGHSSKTERPTVEVDYVIPADKPEFDFKAVKGGTLTIDKQNGVRVTYTGVHCLKIGSSKYDAESESTVRTISFGASGKVE
jgi:hypothetical protein